MRTFFFFFLILSAGAVALRAQDPHAGHDHAGHDHADHGQPAAAPEPKPTVDPAKAPKISFAVPKHDFGVVDEGPAITHLFRFTNTGKGTLRIENVQTSCGCTAAVLSEEDKTVPPGGTGVIKATYNTEGRPGPATKMITVTSNDPAMPNFQLELKMDVVREVNVQPERLYLYGVRHREGRDQAVTVVGKPRTSMKVLSAEPTSGSVTVLGIEPYEDAEQKRKGSVIQVRLPETTAIGKFNDEILVKTDYPKKPELKIQVVGEVQGRVLVSPDIFYFQTGQKYAVKAQITANPPEGFVVRSVRSEKRLVRPSIKRSTFPDGRDRLELSATVVKNLPEGGNLEDRIILETNDPDQPEVYVGVKVNPR